MASALHEGPLILLRREPRLLTELLARAGIPVTDHAAAKMGDAAERAGTYSDLLRATHAMPLFDYEYKTEFAKKHYGDGLAKGIAKGIAKGEREGLGKGKREFLLELLGVRKIKLSREGRARIEACSSSRQLKTWLTRALRATREDELW